MHVTNVHETAQLASYEAQTESGGRRFQRPCVARRSISLRKTSRPAWATGCRVMQLWANTGQPIKRAEVAPAAATVQWRSLHLLVPLCPAALPTRRATTRLCMEPTAAATATRNINAPIIFMASRRSPVGLYTWKGGGRDAQRQGHGHAGRGWRRHSKSAHNGARTLFHIIIGRNTQRGQKVSAPTRPTMALHMAQGARAGQARASPTRRKAAAATSCKRRKRHTWRRPLPLAANEGAAAQAGRLGLT